MEFLSLTPIPALLLDQIATILRTTDGGNHWIPQTDPIPSDLHDVVFTDANTGTAIGPVGLILRTTDGGTNWSQSDKRKFTDSLWRLFCGCKQRYHSRFWGRDSNNDRRGF